MLILGLDPGIATTGYGLITAEGSELKAVDFGTINTNSNTDTAIRLMNIYNAVVFLIEKYKPDTIAIEELFFNKNVRTALIVGHARGVMVLAAAQKNIPLYEYTPLQVKQSVVGFGHADKMQVKRMVCQLLKISKLPQKDDTADALAIAICHSSHCNISGRKLKDQWGRA